MYRSDTPLNKNMISQSPSFEIIRRPKVCGVWTTPPSFCFLKSSLLIYWRFVSEKKNKNKTKCVFDLDSLYTPYRRSLPAGSLRSLNWWAIAPNTGANIEWNTERGIANPIFCWLSLSLALFFYHLFLYLSIILRLLVRDASFTYQKRTISHSSNIYLWFHPTFFDVLPSRVELV